MEKIFNYLFGPVAVMVDPDHDPITDTTWRRSRVQVWVFLLPIVLCGVIFSTYYQGSKLVAREQAARQAAVAATQSAQATALYSLVPTLIPTLAPTPTATP